MSAFALISDLHSNLQAVEAVFHRIDQLGIRDVRCLGDIVGYGADPLAVTRIVMERCQWSLLGNHDWGLFHSLDEFNPLARDALLHSRSRLQPAWWSPQRRAAWNFLRSLAPERSDGEYLYFHGSPRDPVMEYVMRSDGLLEPEKLRQIFQRIDRPTFVGHTHWPGVHWPTHQFEAACDARSRFRIDRIPCIVNVGSVGQPRDGDPRACFAVVSQGEVEFHRVAYDVATAQARILAAGLHPALAERLGRGK